MRFSITYKILSGYVVLGVFFLAVTFYSISTLNKISSQLQGIEQTGGIYSTQPSLGAFQSSARAARESVPVIVVLGGIGFFAGFTLTLFAVFQILSSLNRLKYATQLIADGAFDLDPQIRSRDEIGDLAGALSVMAKKFKNYEQMCLDASPLTRLPGNIAIERALLERMRRGENFALCYLDLDNFKAFGDRYGYARGSEVIKATGELIYFSIKGFDRGDDFVGHIGGDDFVLITSPDNVPGICENIIREFDRIIPGFYAPEDRERGFIQGVDRFGVERQFPIMTISIAVVSDLQREIKTPTEIAQVAAEIKDFVKTLPGSNYLVDRRRAKR